MPNNHSRTSIPISCLPLSNPQKGIAKLILVKLALYIILSDQGLTALTWLHFYFVCLPLTGPQLKAKAYFSCYYMAVQRPSNRRSKTNQPFIIHKDIKYARYTAFGLKSSWERKNPKPFKLSNFSLPCMYEKGHSTRSLWPFRLWEMRNGGSPWL